MLFSVNYLAVFDNEKRWFDSRYEWKIALLFVLYREQKKGRGGKQTITQKIKKVNDIKSFYIFQIFMWLTNIVSLGPSQASQDPSQAS